MMVRSMEMKLMAARQQAQGLVARGAWAEVRALWLRELVGMPDSGDIMVELSYVESHAGGYRKALEWAERASGHLPVTEEGRLGLIRRLHTFNLSSALHATAQGFLTDRGASPTVLAECGRCLSLAGDFAMARRCIDAAIQHGQASEAISLLHAQLLVQEGASQEAEDIFEGLLARNPANAQAWWLLARLKSHTAERNHSARILSALQVAGDDPHRAALLARALHKEADDVGDRALAWSALELMCRAKRRVEHYDPSEERRLLQRLLDFPLDAISAAADQGAVPIFIVGMHRSGTTLLEQMLAASPQLSALGELSDFPAALRYAADCHARDIVDVNVLDRLIERRQVDVGSIYLGKVAWRLDGVRFFTDKQPGNYRVLGLICRALPQARVLHMVRHPLEVCFSNLREIFNGINAFSYDQATLADHYLAYRKLMAHWHRMFPGRILDVNYSDLVADPEGSLRRVSAFCGMQYVPEMADPRNSRRKAVATASTVQVRQRVIDQRVPKWKAYEPHLQPLMKALREGGCALVP